MVGRLLHRHLDVRRGGLPVRSPPRRRPSISPHLRGSSEQQGQQGQQGQQRQRKPKNAKERLFTLPSRQQDPGPDPGPDPDPDPGSDPGARAGHVEAAAAAHARCRLWTA